MRYLYEIIKNDRSIKTNDLDKAKYWYDMYCSVAKKQYQQKVVVEWVVNYKNDKQRTLKKEIFNEEINETRFRQLGKVKKRSK
jgi:hypothetical protein